MPAKNNAAGLGLIPAAIVAVGPSEQPVERLIGLQSAIARAAGWLFGLRLPRIRFTPPLHSAQKGDRR
jgi:hypothetical protein